VAAGVAVHGHAAVGFLHGALLLLQHIGDWLQLLKPVLGGPLSLFLGGLLVPPGHVVGVDHVRLEGRLGKNSLAGLLVDQVAGLAAGAERQIDGQLPAAAHGLCLEWCLLGGLESRLIGGLDGCLRGGLESYFCCRGLESCFFLSWGLC
jgi:hypothetical protein